MACFPRWWHFSSVPELHCHLFVPLRYNAHYLFGRTVRYFQRKHLLINVCISVLILTQCLGGPHCLLSLVVPWWQQAFCPAFALLLPCLMSGSRANLRNRCPKAGSKEETWVLAWTRQLTFWMILQSHPVFLGFSFFFWWVGMEILNERFSSSDISSSTGWKLNILRAEKEYQEASWEIPEGGLGLAELTGCSWGCRKWWCGSLKCRPLPSLASLGNERLWEVGETHRPSLQKSLWCAQNHVPYIYPLLCLISGAWPS